MKCPNCKREIPSDSKFCPDCGSKITDFLRSSCFLSFHDIVIGETSITDIDANIVLAKSDLYGDILLNGVADAKLDYGTVTAFAYESDKKVFSFFLHLTSDFKTPESWISNDFIIDKPITSLRNILRGDDYQFVFDIGELGFIAYKETRNDKNIIVVIDNEQLCVSVMPTRMKDNFIQKIVDVIRGNDK